MKWFLLATLMVLLALTVMVTLSRRKPTPASSTPADNGPGRPLATLDGYPFDVRYSPEARQEALRLAELTKEAYEYFAMVFPNSEPKFTAAFLTPDDWKREYGMPSYQPVEKRLRVATNDNPFWQSFGKMARVTSPFRAYPRLTKTYADDHGNLQLRRFFDLLAVHELAHAFEEQGGAAFPTHWLRELYANLALHSFIASKRPEELPFLTTLPEMQRHIAVFNMIMRLRGYTSLDDFDRHYPAGNPEKPMSGPNYGWYQIRLHLLAREIYEEGGEAALKRMWAFAQSEATHRQRASDYFREHGTLAGWSAGIRATDLAARLGAEVGPSLRKGVVEWN